jgi:hypothetical protein
MSSIERLQRQFMFVHKSAPLSFKPTCLSSCGKNLIFPQGFNFGSIKKKTLFKIRPKLSNPSQQNSPGDQQSRSFSLPETNPWTDSSLSEPPDLSSTPERRWPTLRPDSKGSVVRPNRTRPARTDDWYGWQGHLEGGRGVRIKFHLHWRNRGKLDTTKMLTMTLLIATLLITALLITTLLIMTLLITTLVIITLLIIFDSTYVFLICSYK